MVFSEATILRRERLRRGMTLQQMGDVLGGKVDASRLSKLERRRTEFHLREAKRYADIFGLPVGEIRDERGFARIDPEGGGACERCGNGR